MSFDSAGRWYQLHLQPESWEVGTAYASRKGGVVRGGLSPSAKLKAFEEAVKDELLAQQPIMELGDVAVKIFLWRQLGRGIKVSDATNMQKAIEDAMQGIIFPNDRKVRSISTEIMEQSEAVENPRILINVKNYSQTALPSFMYEEWVRPEPEPVNVNPHYTDGVF